MAAAVPTEDAATVLEQFTHDVANVPAEISHLLEEIQAKDQVIGECRATIAQRDNSLQKFVKANGFGHVKHPKEDLWTKQVASAFEKAQGLQEEKVGLANKAAFLVCLFHDEVVFQCLPVLASARRQTLVCQPKQQHDANPDVNNSSTDKSSASIARSLIWKQTAS